jgi:hypothetical protein
MGEREEDLIFSIFTHMHDSFFPRFNGTIIGWALIFLVSTCHIDFFNI